MTRFRNLRRHFKTVYIALVLGAATTLLVLVLLQNFVVFSRAELSAYDAHFLGRTQYPVSNNIVIVGLDTTSFDDLANQDSRIPRHIMANVVNFLHRAGARVIALAFTYKDRTDRKNDQAFATAIRRANNVILASDFPGTVADPHVQSEQSIEYPIDLFAQAAAGVGITNYPFDQDQTVRRAYLLYPCPGSSAVGGLCPSFALATASVVLHKPWQELARRLPDPMLINYAGPQSPLDPNEYSFRMSQLESVARGEDSPQLFRHKIVLVIPSRLHSAEQYNYNTPYGEMYGGVIHANALQTMLTGDYITPAGDTANNLLIVIVGLVVTLIASRFGVYRSALGVLLVLVAYAGLSLVVFDQFRVWIKLVTPEVAGILAFASIMALRFGTEDWRKRRTREIFGQYVKPEIVDILVNAPDEETALAGARRPISVLFVDVRGFTRMSEAMEPEDVVAVLDTYLEQVTQSVTKFDGTIDKYVGDELMAIWNAPHYQSDHAWRSVLAGLDMVSRIEAINQQLARKGLPSIKYGIGINSGVAVVGQMGSSMRKQYTVIGDTVNTAARLCSAAGGGEIIIGQPTWEEIGDRLDVEETEPLSLKGKHQAMRTLRVVGIASEGPDTAQTARAMAERS